MTANLTLSGNNPGISGQTVASQVSSNRTRGRPFRRRMIAEDEVTSARAVRILGYRSLNISSELKPLSRELVRLGAGASRPTWAYRRADIERIAHIRKVTGLSLRSAVRVRLAELAGTL